MTDDLPPDLEDLTSVITQVQPKKEKNTYYTGDYTKTTGKL